MQDRRQQLKLGCFLSRAPSPAWYHCRSPADLPDRLRAEEAASFKVVDDPSIGGPAILLGARQHYFSGSRLPSSVGIYSATVGWICMARVITV